jgi:hypothetical protein
MGENFEIDVKTTASEGRRRGSVGRIGCDGAWAEAGLTGGRTVGGLVTGGELGEKAGSRGSGSSAGGSTLTSGAMGNACTAGDETADGAASIWQTSCVRASAWASVVETKGISVIGLSGGADWERERGSQSSQQICRERRSSWGARTNDVSVHRWGGARGSESLQEEGKGQLRRALVIDVGTHSVRDRL